MNVLDVLCAKKKSPQKRYTLYKLVDTQFAFTAFMNSLKQFSMVLIIIRQFYEETLIIN